MDGEPNDFTDKSTEKNSVTYRRKCSCGGSSIVAINLSYVSSVINVVFIVLFVLVFLRLENLKTRLSKLENEASLSSRDFRSEASRQRFESSLNSENNRRKNSTPTDSVLSTTRPYPTRETATSHRLQVNY